MKSFLLVLTFFLPMAIFGQFKSSDCVGKWITDEGKAIVEIFEQGGKYYGKIIWTKEIYNKNSQPLKDTKNPDPALRNREVKGIVFMTDFSFDGKDTWKDGKLYDAESGNTYSGYLKLRSIDVLDLRGYMGISMLGRTTTWVRKKK